MKEATNFAKMKNEIILYRADELPEHIEVRLEDQTVWLNRYQIAVLFGRDIKTIGKHINNVFKEGELEPNSTVANFATVQNEGGRVVERKVDFYNLDVIISVGYRVKSKQGTQFRIWATNVLREYLLKGYALNQRMDRIENNIKKANEQYGNYEAKELKTSHDRFLIIDRKELYHIGASLKDLGKKWFAFSKLDGNILNLMQTQITKEVV